MGTRWISMRRIPIPSQHAHMSTCTAKLRQMTTQDTDVLPCSWLKHSSAVAEWW